MEALVYMLRLPNALLVFAAQLTERIITLQIFTLDANALSELSPAQISHSV